MNYISQEWIYYIQQSVYFKCEQSISAVKNYQLIIYIFCAAIMRVIFKIHWSNNLPFFWRKKKFLTLDNVQRFTVENQVHLYSQFAKVQKILYFFVFLLGFLFYYICVQYRFFILIMDKSNITDCLEKIRIILKIFKLNTIYF